MQIGRRAILEEFVLTYWPWIYTAFANSVDLGKLASEEANWSGSALFTV